MSTPSPGVIVVHGRHLTVERHMLSGCLAMISMCLCGLAYWRLNLHPYASRPLEHFLAHRVDGAAELSSLITCIVFFGALIFSLYPFVAVFGFLCKKKTVVMFTCDTITLYLLWWPVRFSRNAVHEVTFLQADHPGVKKAQRRVSHNPSPKNQRGLATYENASLVVMQYGRNLVPVATFYDHEQADQFTVMLQQAAQEALSKPMRAFPVQPRRTRGGNVADV